MYRRQTAGRIVVMQHIRWIILRLLCHGRRFSLCWVRLEKQLWIDTTYRIKQSQFPLKENKRNVIKRTDFVRKPKFLLQRVIDFGRFVDVLIQQCVITSTPYPPFTSAGCRCASWAVIEESESAGLMYATHKSALCPPRYMNPYITGEIIISLTRHSNLLTCLKTSYRHSSRSRIVPRRNKKCEGAPGGEAQLLHSIASCLLQTPGILFG